MAKFKGALLLESRGEFLAMVEEGKAVAKMSLQAALDTADSAALSVASAMVMRLSSWLQSLGLPCEVQQTIKDLLSEDKLFF